MDPFTLGLLTGFAIQDAIFIVGAFFVGPYVTLYVLRKNPEFVASVIRALRKHSSVVKELGLLLGLAWAEDDEVKG